MRFQQVQRLLQAKKIFWVYGHFKVREYFGVAMTSLSVMASLSTSSEVAEEKLQVYIVKTFSGWNQTYLNQGSCSHLYHLEPLMGQGQSLQCVPEWASL